MDVYLNSAIPYQWKEIVGTRRQALESETQAQRSLLLCHLASWCWVQVLKISVPQVPHLLNVIFLLT